MTVSIPDLCPADVGENPGRKRAARHRTDGGDGAVRLIDIYAGILVTYSFFLRHV